MHTDTIIQEKIPAIRQSLNAISLMAANLRLRIEPRLDEADAVYADRKMKRFERELIQMTRTLNSIEQQLLFATAGEQAAAPISGR